MRNRWLRDEVTTPRWVWLLLFIGAVLMLAADIAGWIVQ